MQIINVTVLQYINTEHHCNSECLLNHTVDLRMFILNVHHQMYDCGEELEEMIYRQMCEL